MTKLIPMTTPLRKFEGHEGKVRAVAVFPDKRRMITSSDDKTLHIWNLETGVVLEKMEGHSSEVWRLVVSRDGQLIASGDADGVLIAWRGETGESLTKLINAHSNGETGESLTKPMHIEAHSSHIYSLDFSPDGTVLATGSGDKTTKLWNTKTWEQEGDPIECGSDIYCVGYSPSGELFAIATDSNIQIYNRGTRELVASFKGHTESNLSLAWTRDGTRLLTGGDASDPTLREWDTTTWKQVGDPWTGHSSNIYFIAVNPAGTLVASASNDQHIHLWRLSDRRTVATFKHTSLTGSAIFSVDGKHILSRSDEIISEWAVPNDINSKILAITTARIACIDGDLSTAEELLTQDVNTDANSHTSYAHRSFVMARKQDWDYALQDANKSISIQPSLTGYISKGIALCGKGDIRDARAAFDVAFMYTDQDSETVHFLLLIKAIALFGADQRDEANLLLEELTAGCPNADTRACDIVQAYLRVQLGIKALDGARHDEAVDHFTAALNSSNLSSKSDIHEVYEDLVVLFGWDLKSLWFTAHQKRCQTFLSAGKVDEALKSHKSMMDNVDEITKASCIDWSTEFQKQCSALTATDDRILGAEIPGQDQYGYDAEPNFFREMHGHPQISRPRPQQRSGRIKKLRLAVTRSLRSGPPLAPAPPTTLPPATAPNIFKAQLRYLFTWRSDHAAPPVVTVDVPFAQAKERNAAAGAPKPDEDVVPDEYLDDHPPDPHTQQQTTIAQVDIGKHGGGCCCC